jgi:lycopene beta-cyclase
VVRDASGTREVRATTVIDARGPDRAGGSGGYQKFVGLELVLAQPHGLDAPILMDATVAQLDGFRFLYVLPLAPDRLLVEDTCFSDGPQLDAAGLRARALEYAAARGWMARTIVREERGVLPMTWDAEVADPERGLVVAGYQGGWFHPVTGYSFPVALRVAAAVGEALARGVDPAAAVAALVPAHRAQLRFARRLVWMMFRWFSPEDRAGVLEHFYRLPEDTVRRFYALQLTGRDRARMFLGRPPRGLSLRRMFASPSPSPSPVPTADVEARP